MAEEPLYIKRIEPRQYEAQAKPRGGGNKPIKTVDHPLRVALLKQLQRVEGEFEQAPKDSPFVPMRVILEERAIAKSHWPHKLFSHDRAPIIGAGSPGELFIQLAKSGIASLQQQIARGQTQEAIKAISTIKQILPIDRDYRLAEKSPDEILAAAPKVPDVRWSPSFGQVGEIRFI